MKKRILIINTGGTISSVKKKHGYEPLAGYVANELKTIKALTHKDMPAYEIIEYSPLLDSSNMTVDNWNSIAKDIENNYEKYDGFVIFHGTDTMAYTASALSFILENLQKPVILTGSQIPLSEVRSDALDNIITSLLLAANDNLHEVCIYFAQKLLRGNRSQKIKAQSFDAFDSPNYQALSNVGTNINLNIKLLQNPKKNKFHRQEIEPHFIANFRLFPGFATDVLAHILQKPLKGLVLETYGAGNAQNNDAKFLQLLQKATSSGIVIVNCTQCIKGHVAMGRYATGHTLAKAGLISGFDMTPETAHCKLLYLLSKYQDIEKVKQKMQENLCGELSAP